MKVFRIGEIMSKCNSSFETTAKKAKKPMKVKIEKPKPAENVFALNADREVREKMQAARRDGKFLLAGAVVKSAGVSEAYQRLGGDRTSLTAGKDRHLSNRSSMRQSAGYLIQRQKVQFLPVAM